MIVLLYFDVVEYVLKSPKNPVLPTRRQTLPYGKYSYYLINNYHHLLVNSFF